MSRFDEERVRGFFPDAPERCLKCPGLIQAAQRIERDMSMAGSSAHAALEFIGSDNPHDLISPKRFYPVLSEVFTANAERRLAEARQTAAVLTQGCEGGAFEFAVAPPQEKRRLPGRKPSQPIIHVSCGSAATLAYFIGPVKQ